MQRQRYVILPGEGYESDGLAALSDLSAAGAGLGDGIEILHQVSAKGPKLAALTVEEELALRTRQPELRVVPVTYLHRMWVSPFATPGAAGPKVAGPNAIEVTVVDGASGAPLSGAMVFARTTAQSAFEDPVWDRTNDQGVAVLPVPPGRQLRVLTVEGPTGYWGRRMPGATPAARQTIRLTQIDLGDPRLLLAQYCQGKAETDQADSGVIVGIVDSGIDAGHPALNVSGGTNHVFDELLADQGALTRWGPPTQADAHGTHVAGIVGMRGRAGAAPRGVAPGVTLRSYRVFPAEVGARASSYDVSAAINRAAEDGCQIINLSLGMDTPDDAIRAAIRKAEELGSVVIAAAGNDWRQPVSFPASLPFCVAVSAYGTLGAVPPETPEVEYIATPRAANAPETFVAGFSNMGPPVDHTGPGVGVVSTMPGGGYGAISGTSMAAPAVAGLAASILGQNPVMLALTGKDRCAALIGALRLQAVPKGFGRDFEGLGGH